MTAVLILCVLGIVLLGYAVASRTEKFFDNICLEESPDEDTKIKVLIYPWEGIPDDLGPLLIREGISYHFISEPYIPENLKFMTLVAISDCDLDNLLLCNEARHNYPSSIIIAKCNDVLFLDIFKDIGITRVLTGSPSGEELLFVMKGVS